MVALRTSQTRTAAIDDEADMAGCRSSPDEPVLPLHRPAASVQLVTFETKATKNGIFRTTTTDRYSGNCMLHISGVVPLLSLFLKPFVEEYRLHLLLNPAGSPSRLTPEADRSPLHVRAYCAVLELRLERRLLSGP